MKLLTLLLAFCIASVSCDGNDEEKARLLFSKKICNSFLVVGKDIVVSYNIYNVGTSAALNVQLVDNNFGHDDFDVVGHLQVKLDRIPPLGNVTHTVVVQPRKFGYFNFSAAEISYQPSEASNDIQTVFSSEPGEGIIIAAREYDRKFSSHLFDWFIFALLLIPTLLVPFSMWHNIKIKYELKSKSRSKRD